ncbi:hypothetical protein [Reticulibacter mediterranei]|uniref:hypothetical protein n=1 Tax=Reticulibacter mediterranei TaxID=2778369 RepID=UPI001C68912B|nr:hypothetical protein [Reticulibacter mediterranei]
MKGKMVQEYVVHGEQAARIHWTTTLTDAFKLLFLCFVINYFLTSGCFFFLWRAFNFSSDFLSTWMLGCMFFFALILPPLMFFTSMIARHMAKKAVWSAGRKRAEDNMCVGIALMLFWCFALLIFLLGRGS